MKTLCVLAGAALLAGGCSSYPDSHLVSAPPPAAPSVVTTPVSTPVYVQTVQTPTGQTMQTVQTVQMPTAVVVSSAPPALQTEIMPPQPSSSHSWVSGHWSWHNNRYEWVAGHWEIPPMRGAVWTPPRYQNEGGMYRYYEGYWNY